MKFGTNAPTVAMNTMIGCTGEIAPLVIIMMNWALFQTHYENKSVKSFSL